MSPDDIDTLTLNLYDFIVKDMGVEMNEYGHYELLHDWLHSYLDKFVTRDRNYN